MSSPLNLQESIYDICAPFFLSRARAKGPKAAKHKEVRDKEKDERGRTAARLPAGADEK